MNNYLFFLRIITLLFLTSAITVSLVYYMQLKKRIALNFAGFLTGLFMLLFGELITYLSLSIPTMWFSKGSFLYVIVSTPSTIFITYFGISFIVNLRGKVLGRKVSLLITLPLLIVIVLRRLHLIGELIMVVPVILTTAFMILFTIYTYKSITDPFFKLSLRVLIIETLLMLPFMVLIMHSSYVKLGLMGIYIFMLILSFEFIIFAYKFMSMNPYIKNGVITEAFKEKFSLTEREVEVVTVMLRGKQSKEIGEELYISHRTVSTHISNIYKKLAIKNRLELHTLINGNWA